MTFDPTTMNAKNAIATIEGITDPAELQAAWDAEEAGSARKTVLAAIASAAAEIAEQATEVVEDAAEAAEEAAAAEEAPAPVPEKLVTAPPNVGTWGLITKGPQDQ